MSIFGSMTTAVLGLSAQSKALGHISDNIANASTNGYKRVNTAFETLVLQSNQRLHEPGGVTAAPVFMNNIQGNLTQVQSATNAAIQGQGFFSVSKLSRGLTGPGQQGEMVQTQTGTLNADNVYYTRVGDFELDKNRYLVNSAGFALNGWIVDDATGQLKKDVVQPLQVNTLTDKPQPTKGITLGANLPATPTPGVPIPSSSIQVYDTQGNARTIQFNWRQDGTNDWRLGISAPGSSMQPVEGTLDGGSASSTLGRVISGLTPVAQESSVLVTGTSIVPPSSVTISGAKITYPDGTQQDNLHLGDHYAVRVNGAVVADIGPLAATGPAPHNISAYRSFSDIAAALAAQINTNFGTQYTATVDPKDPTKFTVTTTGQNPQPVDVKSTCTNALATTQNIILGPSRTPATATAPQIDTFTFTPAAGNSVDVGDEFRMTIAGKDIRVQVTAADDDGNLTMPSNGVSRISIATVMAGVPATVITQRMADMVNLVPTTGVTATAAGNTLTLTGTTVNTSYVSSASVVNADSRPNSAASSSNVTFKSYAATTSTNGLGAQVDQVDYGTPALKVPDEFSVTTTNMAGNPVTYKTSVTYSNINAFIKAGDGNEIDGALGDLVKQINNDPTAAVTAAVTKGVLTLTAKAGAPALTTTGSQTAITATDNVRIGDSYTVTVDNVDYTLSVTKDNILTVGNYGGIANALAAQINSSRPQAAVIATVENSELKLVARNPGTKFDMKQTFTSGASTNNTWTGPTKSDPTTTRGQRQDFSFPQTAIDIGDRYTLSIDGQPVSVDVTESNFSNLADINGVLQELSNKINAAGLNVVASATGGKLSIVHNTPNTGYFNATVDIFNATGSSGQLSAIQRVSNVAGVQQSQAITLTGTPGDVGAKYSVTVDGTTIDYVTTGNETSMEDITAAMADLINKKTSLKVTASAQGSVLNLIAKTANGDPANAFVAESSATAGNTPAHVKLSFGNTNDNVGTITKISTAGVGTGTAVAAVNQTTGSDATITFTVDYGFGPQQITLNVGQFGKSGGVTQYAGNEINVRELVQDGASRGQYKEVVYGDNGDVIVNYDNGRSRVIGRIPVVTFNNPNALQREAGGVYIETDEGGRPNFNDPDTNGAGAVVANSVEASNVDIADEFTKLIVTQRTYSANTKIVTTSDEMLQEVLGLKR